MFTPSGNTEIEWETRTANIGNESGKTLFEQKDVEVPKFWSQLATNVVVSKPVAKTVLPAVSALIVANGLQGFVLHARGIGQRPGGWKLARYNVEMGPPLFAPLLLTMVGGMGLLAAILRREGE